MIAKAPISAFPVVGLPFLQPGLVSMPAFAASAASGNFALSTPSQFRTFWQPQRVLSDKNPFLAEVALHNKGQEIIAGSRALSALSSLRGDDFAYSVEKGARLQQVLARNSLSMRFSRQFWPQTLRMLQQLRKKIFLDHRRLCRSQLHPPQNLEVM